MDNTKKKSILVKSILGVLGIAVITLIAMMFFQNKDKQASHEEVEEPTKEVSNTSESEVVNVEELTDIQRERMFNAYISEQEMFTDIMDMASTVNLPTVFDKSEKDPFKRVNAVAQLKTLGNYIEYEMHDNETKQKLLYTVYSTEIQYEEALKEKHEDIELSNGQKVSIVGDTYYWYDDGTKLYYSIASKDKKTTGKKELKVVILSLGNSKFNPISKIGFNKEDTVLQPTSHLDLEEGISPKVEVVYVNDGAETDTTLKMHYSQYTLLQKHDGSDYMDEIDLNAKTVEKMTFHEGEAENAYIDTATNTLYYTEGNTTVKLVMLDEKQVVEKEKLGEIIHSLLH